METDKKIKTSYNIRPETVWIQNHQSYASGMDISHQINQTTAFKSGVRSVLLSIVSLLSTPNSILLKFP